MSDPSLRLDHVLTFTLAERVETSLERYRSAGFLVSDHIAEWDPGLRNGFINLWPEYLELLCVDDSDRFRTEASDTLKQAAAACRPYGLGFYSDDTVAIHDRWTRLGLEVPPPEMLRLAATPESAPPDFCEMEAPSLEGAECFVLTSYFPNAAMRRFMQVAPNTVFGLGGLTLVADQPHRRSRRWAETLGIDVLSTSDGEASLAFGLHRFRWISPQEYATRFDDQWIPGVSEIAMVHLLAEDPTVAAAMLRLSGWNVDVSRGGIVVAHHSEDGFTFAIEQGLADQWNASRLAVWGETLELQRETL